MASTKATSSPSSTLRPSEQGTACVRARGSAGGKMADSTMATGGMACAKAEDSTLTLKGTLTQGSGWVTRCTVKARWLCSRMGEWLRGAGCEVNCKERPKSGMQAAKLKLSVTEMAHKSFRRNWSWGRELSGAVVPSWTLPWFSLALAVQLEHFLQKRSRHEISCWWALHTCMLANSLKAC